MRRGAAPKAAKHPTRTEQIRERLLSGEKLDRRITQEYGVDGSLFTKIVRELKAAGCEFVEGKTKRNVPATYQLVKVKPPTSRSRNGSRPKRSAAPQPPVEPPDERSTFEKVRDALIAGDKLSGGDVVERFEGAAQTIGVVVARLKEEGYLFDYELDGKAKRWYVTGKGEPKPKRHRGPAVGGSRNGHRLRMPVPQVDAPTDCVMAFRVTDDEVQFAVRQAGRVFTAQLLSVVEAE